MARDGFDGLGKMRKGEKPAYTPTPMGEKKPPMAGGGGEGGGEKQHTVTEHADGHFTSQMHGGEPMEHPNHLHLMAHMGHHITGGDKHHVVHHDGMEAHSHSVDESGEHMDHEGNSADDAKMALDKFLGEEAQEPAHQDGGEQNNSEPEYGGL
jgi:hypothetical protein